MSTSPGEPASGRQDPDLFGFTTRNKVPSRRAWRTSTLVPASKVRLRQGEGFGVDCERNGVVVIDSDAPEARSAFGDLWERHEGTRRLRTYVVKTPRGHHFYFNAINGVTVRNSAGKLAPNLDVRGVGGFVNAPPTPGYRVLRNAPIADLPEWLAQLLVPMADSTRSARGGRTTTMSAHSLGGLLMTLANAVPGTRNNVLHWCLCRAIEMPAHKHRSALKLIRNQARMIGLTDNEIEKTISSVFGCQT